MSEQKTISQIQKWIKEQLEIGPLPEKDDEWMIQNLLKGLSFEPKGLIELSKLKPIATGNFGDSATLIMYNLLKNKNKIKIYLEKIFNQTDIDIFFIPYSELGVKMIFYKSKRVMEIFLFLSQYFDIPTMEEMFYSLANEPIEKGTKKTLMNILFNDDISNKYENPIYLKYLEYLTMKAGF